MINTPRQIILGFFAKLKVLHCNLADELEVLLEFLTLGQMVVVEFHASHLGIRGWTHTERRHAATVDVERTIWEEVEEQPIIGLLWVCNVLGEVVVVAHGVEGRWVVDRE